ncbi:MAG: PEP-CTERM sorting domain-containing protein [Phycisphaerae bacterium]
MRSRTAVVGVLAFILMGTSAYADYTLAPVTGATHDISATVKQGDSFNLDLLLSSNASNTHFASVFAVQFSKQGLQYNSHTWGAPYTTGGADDRSKPASNLLPLLITPSTYVAGSGDTGATDLYFENFLSDPLVFGTGTVLSMNFTVPSNFPTGLMTITAVPDSVDAFDNGAAIPTTGASFTLNVTAAPEPASIALLGLGAMALLRRRRSV